MKSPKRSFLGGGPLLFALLLLTRCSSSNSLSGSISQIFPLNFNSISVWRSVDAFQVTYYFTEFGNESIVVQLTVELAGLSFGPGKTIDLSGNDADGNPRTTVIHLTNGEAVSELPTVQQGSLSLSGGGQIPGEETTGSFNLSFVQNGNVGAGYTISASFDGPLQSGAFTPDGSYPADSGPDGSVNCGVIYCVPDSGPTTAGSIAAAATGGSTAAAATGGSTAAATGSTATMGGTSGTTGGSAGSTGATGGSTTTVAAAAATTAAAAAAATSAGAGTTASAAAAATTAGAGATTGAGPAAATTAGAGTTAGAATTGGTTATTGGTMGTTT